MIQTALSKSVIQQTLTTDFIVDTHPLRAYAGFDDASEYRNMARQTFTVILPEATIAAIQTRVAELYNTLIANCWPANEVLPFDMVRFDAFLDPHDSGLQIIELNTRNVGMHEIAEWLDEVTAVSLGVDAPDSLNTRFVSNQKLLHSTHFGSEALLLYMTKPMIPSWVYMDALQQAYSSVQHVTSEDAYTVEPDGVRVNGATYKAIARKYAWPLTPELEQLDSDGVIRILQPVWMRQFGHKDYLPNFASSDVLSSSVFDPSDIQTYRDTQQNLVLKVIDSGGSKSVYLGPQCSPQEWEGYLQIASAEPHMWIMQQYVLPAAHEVIVHGKGIRTVPMQLGIFVLPDPNNSQECSIDLVAKAYGGSEQHFTFDPSGLNPDIWFGNVVALSRSAE